MKSPRASLSANSIDSWQTIMAEDEFNPALAEYSDEDFPVPVPKHPLPTLGPEPRKRPKLPCAKDLLSPSAPPPFLAGISLHPTPKPVQPKPTTAVIQKPPTLNPTTPNAIEQYDYFAQDPEADLSRWQAPQDMPDRDRPMDKRKLIKKIDTRRVAVLGLDQKRGKYVKDKGNRWEFPLPQ